jgi:hypothetical protein
MSAITETAFWVSLVLAATSQVAQAREPDWLNIASMPFAMAAAAFLIWSVVKLLGIVFDGWKSQNVETTSTLRDQIGALRQFQTETLVALIGRVSTALEHDAGASTESTRAWHEVHEDFRDLIMALHTRPCLHDSDLREIEKRNGLDPKAVERVQHRNERANGGSET